MNDSAIGLVARHEEDDLVHIRDLVVLRMTQAYRKEEEVKEERKWQDEIDELKIQLEREVKLRKTAEEQLNEKKTGKFSFFSKKE